MSYTRREKAKYNAKRLIEVVSQKLSRPIARWSLQRRLNINVIGSEKKPKDDSFIEVCNHATYADGLILGAYEQRIIHFWIQKEDPENRLSYARRTLYNFLIWMWGHIGVSVLEGKSSNKNAIKRSIDYLNFRKSIIAIFPEGPTMDAREYAENGKRPPLHRGAAHIALISEKPIVPIGIYVDVPEYMKPTIFDRKRKNKKIIENYIKKHGKLDYRITVGDPIYVKNRGNNSCELATGNTEDPLDTKKVYFKNQKELETILINEAMKQCYKLADPNNIEGKLNKSLFLSYDPSQKQCAY
ncbi:1-acyl-sn-glycerol-3-phosphate acyltransferase [Candidatus Woesearchaeota archaeon]|nr:1-acyl-sn-glycerol-3-phosphate acyltransferase [Candidatus Woesearchaeota archaeon]